MKQKLIIIASILLLLAVIGFMVKDLFVDDTKTASNPYQYDLGNLKDVDPKLVTYKEELQMKIGFEEVYGIAVDSKDKIYVVGNDTVEVFNKTGQKTMQFKIEGIARCTAFDGKDRLFLGMMEHVEIRDVEGKLLSKWESMGDKAILTSIALTDSFVFVADAGNNVVYRYNYDGKLINKIGEKNKEKGIEGFVIPSLYFDLAIGRDGELWVVNPGTHTLMAFAYDGRLISSWTKTSMQIDGFSGCCNPSHVAMLADGSFVTSEKGIERVKIHSPTGELKCVVATPAMFTEGTKGLDIAVDSKERIVLLDPMKRLVRIFVEKHKN